MKDKFNDELLDYFDVSDYYLVLEYPNDIYETINLWIKHGNDINQKNEKNMTSLMIACCDVNKVGMYDIVNYLLKLRADVNTGNPLMFAADYSITDESYNIVKLLIEYGADVNAQDDDGWMSLMYAVECQDSYKTIELLINNGANVNLLNKYNQNALSVHITRIFEI
jgi:ankyrin repeat protein